MGRKSKCNKRMAKIISEYISKGYTEESSAILAGLGPSTYYRYKANNREFREVIEGARQYNKELCLSTIIREACGEEELDKDGNPTGKWIKEPNWKAAAWWLERRYPDEYGKKGASEIHTRRKKPPVKISKTLLPEYNIK